ncbi:MAG: hypothetical protein LBS69_10365 [Prevotellaceae bacterium]|nr:hypothetical protein [Prevotellaceae bacterium]
MNKIITILLIAAVFISCSGQTGTGRAKTVRAYSPDMNNMEMLSMSQLPGWQLLAGTQWTGTAYCNSIKGVNEHLNAYFFIDGNRNYSQTQFNRSGTSDGKTVYLNLMTAADYLDYVFRRQFPNIKNAKRVMLKTVDQYSEDERRQLEEQRMQMYNTMVDYARNNPAATTGLHIHKQTIDRAAAEYRWLQNGDTVIHFMEVIIHATYQDIRSQYLNTSTVLWNQQALWSATVPAKNRKKAEKDIEQMLPSIKYNEQYIADLNNIVMQGIRHNEQESMRIKNEMAQFEIRHQQNMSRQIQETHEYVMNSRREVNASRQASMERINQGWTDVIKGVDRYVGTDGKVMEVPVSMGSKVWQSAEGGTIYTSDSYLFNPVDYAVDRNGNIQEFRQLQLLK